MRFITTRIVVSACILVAGMIGTSIGCVYLNGSTEELIVGAFGMIGLVAAIYHVLHVVWGLK